MSKTLFKYFLIKHLNLSLIFLLILCNSCSNQTNEVIVSAEENKPGCHMCPGYIFIKRGNTIDTLKMGTWGYPPDFIQFKDNDRDYVALKFLYTSGGLDESRLSILSLNEDNYLTYVFDTLISDEQMDNFRIKRRDLEFRAPDTLLLYQHNEIFNAYDETNVRVDSLSNLFIIKTHTDSSWTKQITINALIDSSWGGRGDQGGLIISNGVQKDTIYDCTYGRTPDYEIIDSDGNKYLFASCLINGGGTNWQTFHLWSLDEDNFMKQLLHKEFFTGKEGHYNSKTGDLVRSNNINIHPLTNKIKTWMNKSRIKQNRNGVYRNEEIRWLMEKEYAFRVAKNKAIINMDSSYSLLNISDDDIPSLEILSGQKKYEFELDER